MNHCWWVANRFQDVEVCLCVTFHFFLSSKKKDKGKATLLNELTRDDKTIPAVVPLSAKNRYGQFFQTLELAFENLCYAHARVFHQNQTWNSIFLSRKTIHFAELFGSKDLHRKVFGRSCFKHVDLMLSFPPYATCPCKRTREEVRARDLFSL